MQSPRRRGTTRAGVRRSAVALIALPFILLAGCAQQANRQATATPSATLSTPTATAASDVTPTPGPFVCAQPAGAHGRYAYVAADGQLTLVNGCDATEIHGRDSRTLAPQAFSPDGSWLLATEGVHDPQATPNMSECDVLIDTATGAQTLTPLCNPTAIDYTRGWIGFIGWGDNATYYDAGWGAGSDASVKIYRVNMPALSVTRVATLAWVANLANQRTDSGMVLRNGAIYYAGYASASDHGHAWLRRYSLASGLDTRIVALGIAGTGGCQVQMDNTPCLWTGPWDISADGARLAFHNPGPKQSLSDTDMEQGTPMYLAKSDGTSPSQLFLNTGAVTGFLSPYFSPDGAYVTTHDATTLTFERLANHSIIAAPSSLRWPAWTSTPGYAVLDEAWDSNTHPVLLNVETGAQVYLQINSRNYVWANAA